MSRTDRESQGGVDTAEKKRQKTAHPKQYRVILLNDNYTSMDFVVAILEGVFRKSPAEAVQIMLTIHKKGSGLAGVYPKEVAEAKIEMVHSKAKDAGYPLRGIMEPIV